MMLINQKFVLCRYYGAGQNAFADGEIYNNTLTITAELMKENSNKVETIIIFFDEENTRKLFNLVKVKDFKEKFCGVEGAKKLEQFCKENKIKSEIKRQG